MKWRKYLFPNTVEEALQMLAEHNHEARIIAGGTDLVLQAERGTCPSTVMVDITRIPNLNYIEEREGYIEIGAQVTHAQIANSALIQERAHVLAEACSKVGGPQIRNVATLVGNIVNALPAADGAVGLFTLDAEVHVAELEREYWQSIAELYAGVGECTIDPCVKMVTAIRFEPLENGMGSAFERLAKRKALVLPILNAGAAVGVKDGKFDVVRIAVGPVAPTPFRATAAEERLVGAAVDDNAALDEAARLAMRDAKPRSSTLRGSAEYRTAMVEVLARRAVTRAAAMC